MLCKQSILSPERSNLLLEAGRLRGSPEAFTDPCSLGRSRQQRPEQQQAISRSDPQNRATVGVKQPFRTMF